MSHTCRIFQVDKVVVLTPVRCHPAPRAQVLLNKVTAQGAVDEHAREDSASGLVTLSPTPGVPSFPSASGAWSWSRSPRPRGFFPSVFRVGAGDGGGAMERVPGTVASGGGRRAAPSRLERATGKDTMGDLPRDPGHVVEQLSRSLQTLKDRLESLEHQLRANVSNAGLPGDFREVLQRRLGELERQLLRKVAELEDEKSLLHNETSAHRQKTESTLNALLQRVTELERGNSAFKSPDAFKVSLPLRTNYLYGKIKKTLPELYAFTICLWLRSSASPGIGTPFSYAVPGQANEIVLIEWGNNPIELLINDKVAQLPLFVSDGKWHHICVTWTTRDGMWEAFQDGEKLGTGENLAPWHPIKPGGVLILGQEQDTVGGRFDATQAFVGELSQFNIWDRVLRAQEIVNIANCSTNMPGNIIPWVDNNVDVFGGASKWPVETCEERLLDL
ncbi:PREDICTED: neuronal pentraxin-2 [Colobus angolensis palliatus]|uniref:neuronal pentraxin-2 n=1 Tax=Colobus angolensis palliatus TaxID=336983 RepID=UPI0005F3C4B4|nr:PREDICTED: neuronal pentraxin-2 [Colobus angolensis palliatus]